MFLKYYKVSRGLNNTKKSGSFYQKQKLIDDIKVIEIIPMNTRLNNVYLEHYQNEIFV